MRPRLTVSDMPELIFFGTGNAPFVTPANDPSPPIKYTKEVMRTANALNSHFVKRDTVDPALRNVGSCGDITDGTVTTERRATPSTDEDTSSWPNKEEMECIKRGSPDPNSGKLGSRHPKSQQGSGSWNGGTEASNSLLRSKKHGHDRTRETAKKYVNLYDPQGHRSSNYRATSQFFLAERSGRGRSDELDRCDIEPQLNERYQGEEKSGTSSDDNVGQEDISSKAAINVARFTNNNDTGHEGEKNNCSRGKAPGRSICKDGLDARRNAEKDRRGGRKCVAWRDQQIIDAKSLVPQQIERGLDLVTKVPKSDFEARNDQETSSTGLCTLPETEHVKTIELGKLAGNRLEHSAIIDATSRRTLLEEDRDFRGPDDEQNWSNQNEERDLDEGREVDLTAWEGPHEGKSVTSRLQRHTSGVGCDRDNSLPPLREFVTKHKLEYPPKVRQKEALSSEIGILIPGARDSTLGRANSSVKASRRKRAADLEWNYSPKPQQVKLWPPFHAHQRFFLWLYIKFHV